MAKWIKTLIFIIPLIGILSLVSYRLYDDLNPESKSAKKKVKKKKAPKVKTVFPDLRDYQEKIQYFGNLEPFSIVNIYPKEESRITYLHVDVSHNVRRGDLLVELDSKQINEIIKQKKAALKIAEATVRQEELNLRHKQSTYERTRYAFSDKIVPIQELDDAKAEYDMSKASLSLSRAKLKEAEAQLEEIETRLKEYKLYSPINGIISQKLVESGSLAKPSQAILEILNINTLKLIVDIAEQDLKKIITSNGKIDKRIRADISIDAINKSFQSPIYKIYPTMDSKTRTIKIEIRLNNRKRELKPGYYCRIHFNLNRNEKVYFIPVEAVYFDEVHKSSYIQIVKNNQVQVKKVTIAPYNDDEVIIKNGVDNKTAIVSPYNSKIKDGTILADDAKKKAIKP